MRAKNILSISLVVATIGCNNMGSERNRSDDHTQTIVKAIWNSPESPGVERGSWTLGFIYGLCFRHIYPDGVMSVDKDEIKIIGLADSSKITRSQFRSEVEVAATIKFGLGKIALKLADEELDRIFFQGMIKGIQIAKEQVSAPVALGFCFGWLAKHDGREANVTTKIGSMSLDRYLLLMIDARKNAGRDFTKLEESEIAGSISDRRTFEMAASLGHRTREEMSADFKGE